MMAEELPNIIMVETKLYDLGVSRHMSPFCNKFVMYQPIPPCPIVTANKHTFYAEGVGNLQINVPNGEVLTPVLLKDTLHVPQIDLTIVSIGRIAKASYSVSFEDNHCKIRKDQDWHIVGSIDISVLMGCLTHLGPAGASWGQLVPAGASWYNTLKLASCHVHRPCPNPLQSPHRVMTSKQESSTSLVSQFGKSVKC